MFNSMHDQPPAAFLPVDHPMLAEWPDDGGPPWESIDTALFPAAFATALAVAREEIRAIADDPAPAAFDTVIAALERAGAMLGRISRLFSVYASNLNFDPIPEQELTIYPMLAAYGDEVTQNPALFARVAAVRDRCQELDEPQRRLVEETWRSFVRAGALASEEDKARIAEINQRLSSLAAAFSQKLLSEEETACVMVDNPAALEGMAPDFIASLRMDDGRYRIANTRSVVDPVLKGARNRALRERVFLMFSSRGDNEGANNTHATIAETLSLRRERSRLLGFPSYAAWALDDTMARTPEAANGLLERVWPLARAAALRDLADLERLAGHPLEAWDVSYYAERLRKERFDFDDAALKPYLALSRVKDAMMWSAGRLFGLSFTRIPNASAFHPDAEVWRVMRGGRRVGDWVFDPYARAGKQSGAWMSDLRTQQRLCAQTPIVTNNSNFLRPADGGDPLISWDDAITMFHEFGHALHSLNSDVVYPSQAGVSVSSDFVELPSQLNERWLSAPETMQFFLTHATTGEPMPEILRARIAKAKTFMKGVDTCEYLASAFIDMALHEAEDGMDHREVVHKTLARLQLPRPLAPIHGVTHFQHVFAGEGYAAGYWSYLWADVLACDAAEAFVEAGDWFDPETASRYLATILSVGDSIDPAQSYRNFRGREPDPAALMRDRGLAAAP